MNNEHPVVNTVDRLCSRRKRGFSFIEVISAIAILSILVLMIGRLFADAQQAMQVGLRSAETNANARAVLEFMARDIQTAIFDHPETSGTSDGPYLRLWVTETSDSPPSTTGYLGIDPSGGRELFFVAPINRPADDERENTIVAYWIRRMRREDNTLIPNRYELRRAQFADPSQWAPYTDSDWSFDPPPPDELHTNPASVKYKSSVMIQNVRSVRFNYGTDITATSATGGGFAPGAALTDDAAADGNPLTPLAFLDIHLELLSPRDARRAAELFNLSGATGSTVAFVERAVRRYHQRVFFHNALGYYRPDR